MYYCTIYTQSRSDKSAFELFMCLSYQMKADAESFKQKLAQQALDNGGRIYADEDEYTTLNGKIIFKRAGIVSNRSNNFYKIGVEKGSTKFALLADKTGVSKLRLKDGLAFEKLAAELTQHKLEEELAKQTEATNNLLDFEAEIKDITDLYLLLRSYIRYAVKRTDKKKLSDLTVKKIHELTKS